jgi:hypothetical protein
MKLNWQGLIKRENGDPHGDVNRDLQVQVDAAHREWQAAQQYFQMVSEPELVDHAIFTLEAAQRKYMYLFRQLRHAQGVDFDQEG